MNEISPESPERRARRGKTIRGLAQLRPGDRAWEVTKRVAIGVYNEGFIHAGNLAYLSLIALFPFFIVAAAIASVFGREPETLRALANFLQTLPPQIATLLEKPILDVIAARTGSLLWLGALVGLWTVGSFIETIRDVFRRAYGTQFNLPFWRYRLGSAAVIVGSVVLALVALVVQGALIAAEQFIYRLLPWADNVTTVIGLSRLVPGAVMFGALYMLFYSVTPKKYRDGKSPKWPGALLTTAWWLGATEALPWVLAQLGGYDLTYGSLAGVVVMLLFFFLVGLGITTGAQLNAALAEEDPSELKAAEVTE